MSKRRKRNRNPNHGKGLLLRQQQSGKIYQLGSEAPERLMLMDFKITWDLMPEPSKEALPRAKQDRMQVIYDLVHQNPKSIIVELRDLAAAHPEVLCLKNWLICALRQGSNADLAEALAIGEQLWQERPDYFFARTTLADLWLDVGEVEKAAELIFGSDLTPSNHYMNRDLFHISEIRHWAMLCARIKIFQGEMKIAQGYRDMLHELEPNSPHVQHLDYIMQGDSGMIAKLTTGLKKLFEKVKSSEEKREQRRIKKAEGKKSAPALQKKPSNPDQLGLFGDS